MKTIKLKENEVALVLNSKTVSVYIEKEDNREATNEELIIVAIASLLTKENEEFIEFLSKELKNIK